MAAEAQRGAFNFLCKYFSNFLNRNCFTVLGAFLYLPISRKVPSSSLAIFLSVKIFLIAPLFILLENSAQVHVNNLNVFDSRDVISDTDSK